MRFFKRSGVEFKYYISYVDGILAPPPFQSGYSYVIFTVSSFIIIIVVVIIIILIIII